VGLGGAALPLAAGLGLIRATVGLGGGWAADTRLPELAGRGRDGLAGRLVELDSRSTWPGYMR